jgi:U2 small nuclear ribonucleoprotein A'
LFKSRKGKEIQREIQRKAKTSLAEAAKAHGPSQEEMRAIREAISKATSLEEVERLNRLLQAGQIPGRMQTGAQNGLFFIRQIYYLLISYSLF